MAYRRFIGPVLKLSVLAAALVGIWRVSHPPPQPATEEIAEDERNEEVQVAVSVSAVTGKTIHEFVTAYGVVEPAPAVAGKPAGGSRVSPAIGGIVETVRCGEGDHVAKGQVLFTLDGRVVEAEVERAKKAVESEQANVDRLKSQSVGAAVVPAWRVSAVELTRDLAQADLDRAVAHQALLAVTSPLAGRVEMLVIQPGEWADPLAVAVEVVDPDRLVVAASVSAMDLHSIKTGQSARIELSVSNATTRPSTVPSGDPTGVSGPVVLVDTRLDPKTGMGSADVAVPPFAGMRVGQFVRVRIVTAERWGLTVPAESIIRDAKGHFCVAAVGEDGRYAALLPVEVGIRDGDDVEVSAIGLKEGQLVATTGSYALLQGDTRVRLQGH